MSNTKLDKYEVAAIDVLKEKSVFAISTILRAHFPEAQAEPSDETRQEGHEPGDVALAALPERKAGDPHA